MKKIVSLIFLVILFFLALTPEWSILSVGQKLAENEAVATLIIQSFLVIVTISAVAFVFFNLPFGKKKKEE